MRGCGLARIADPPGKQSEAVRAIAVFDAQKPGKAPLGEESARPRRPAQPASCSRRRPAIGTVRVTDLENALSRHLGQQVWRETGLGAPDGTARLEARVALLEQERLDLRQQLEERDEELAAARAANRTLLAQANRSPGTA